MAALHEALSTLGPLSYDSLPSDSQEELPNFLRRAFEAAALAVESVPPPPPVPPGGLAPSSARSRSNTASSTNSSSSTVWSSAARSAPPAPEIQAFQKDWKDMKVSANPHDIKVYKLSSKDGQGAWFARRSVHEGIGFSRFRRGLRREFEEGLKLQRESQEGDGENKADGKNASAASVVKPGVRGIGCEKRFERRVAKGIGYMDSLQLSAIFGPVTARDFVEVCMSSSGSYRSSNSSRGREFTLVSRPLSHPEAPPRNGFVRGFYESIEYIREIRTPPTVAKSRSSMSLPSLARKTVAERATTGRNRSQTTSAAASPLQKAPGNVVFQDGSKPGNGKSAESETEEVHNKNSNNSQSEKEDADEDDEDPMGDEAETFPVEWVMITRSNPGGSVPRFMVEKGTPGSIVKDAEKFLAWAVDKEHHDEASDDEIDQGDDEEEGGGTAATQEDEKGADVPDTAESSGSVEQPQQQSQQQQQPQPQSSAGNKIDDDGDETSVMSFQTASSGGDDDDESTVSSNNTGSTTNAGSHSSISKLSENSRTDSMTSLNMQRRKLTEKAAKQKEKDAEKQKRELEKEEARKRKLEEKHERERVKRQEKFLKEQEKSEVKMRRETEKILDRKRKLELKDERLRFEREREELKGENNLLRKEKGVLLKEVESLKKEIEKLKAAAAASRNRASSAELAGVRGTSTPTPPGSLNGDKEQRPSSLREVSPIPDNKS